MIRDHQHLYQIGSFTIIVDTSYLIHLTTCYLLLPNTNYRVGRGDLNFTIRLATRQYNINLTSGLSAGLQTNLSTGFNRPMRRITRVMPTPAPVPAHAPAPTIPAGSSFRGTISLFSISPPPLAGSALNTLESFSRVISEKRDIEEFKENKNDHCCICLTAVTLKDQGQ